MPRTCHCALDVELKGPHRALQGQPTSGADYKVLGDGDILEGADLGARPKHLDPTGFRALGCGPWCPSRTPGLYGLRALSCRHSWTPDQGMNQGRTPACMHAWTHARAPPAASQSAPDPHAPASTGLPRLTQQHLGGGDSGGQSGRGRARGPG